MSEGPVLMLIGGMMALAALGMLLEAIWPKRQGQTPHCAKCDYIVFGLAGQTCPECGNLLTKKTTVHGERIRSPRQIAVAAMLTIGIWTPLIVACLAVNWYQYLPSALLALDVRAFGNSASPRAWRELLQRAESSQLSASTCSGLIEPCLVAQGTNPTGSIEDYDRFLECMNLLGRAYSSHSLSTEQEQRFFKQMIKLDLQVRAHVRAGDAVPFEVPVYVRGPGIFQFRVAHPRLVEEQRTVQPESELLMAGQVRIDGSNRIWPIHPKFTCQAAGRHRIRLEGTLEIRPYQPGATTIADLLSDAAPPCYSQSISLPAEFDAAAAGSTNDVRLIADPSLRQTILAGEQYIGLSVSRLAPGKSPVIRVETPSKSPSTPLPIDVAFQAFLRVDGKEHPLGYVTGVKGSGISWDMLPSKYDGPVVPSADLILRTSVEAARQTISISEVWDGELIYKNIPVQVFLSPDGHDRSDHGQ